MTEYFCEAQSNPAGVIPTTHLITVETDTPQRAITAVIKQRRPDSGWYAIWIYENIGAHYKKKKPLTQWLSAWAQTRMKGVRCINCRGTTKLVVARAGVGGYDEHRCKKCNALVLVDCNGAVLQSRTTSNA